MKNFTILIGSLVAFWGLVRFGAALGLPAKAIEGLAFVLAAVAFPMIGRRMLSEGFVSDHISVERNIASLVLISCGIVGAILALLVAGTALSAQEWSVGAWGLGVLGAMAGLVALGTRLRRPAKTDLPDQQ